MSKHPSIDDEVFNDEWDWFKALKLSPTQVLVAPSTAFQEIMQNLRKKGFDGENMAKISLSLSFHSNPPKNKYYMQIVVYGKKRPEDKVKRLLRLVAIDLTYTQFLDDDFKKTLKDEFLVRLPKIKNKETNEELITLRQDNLQLREENFALKERIRILEGKTDQMNEQTVKVENQTASQSSLLGPKEETTGDEGLTEYLIRRKQTEKNKEGS